MCVLLRERLHVLRVFPKGGFEQSADDTGECPCSGVCRTSVSVGREGLRVTCKHRHLMSSFCHLPQECVHHQYSSRRSLWMEQYLELWLVGVAVEVQH